jgi:biopolymer transport protein ExbD
MQGNNTQPGNNGYRIMADINMIPFIDICLVLLIIFMVMTPMLVRSQLKVDLPKSQMAENAQAVDKIVEIQVLADGTVMIDARKVPQDGLDQVLQRKLPDPANQSVMIQADRSVPFEHVVRVMGGVRKLGCTKMGVAVTTENRSR